MAQRHSRSQLLIARARALGPVPTAVVYPCSRDALAGAMQARAVGLITPILIGPRTQITDIAAAENIDPFPI